MDLFEVKIKYLERTDDGKLAKNTSSYIIEAFNFTDAEAIVTNLIDHNGYVTPEIKSMKPVKYTDIFDSNDTLDDIWYKVSIRTLVEVKENGTEKWEKQYILVKGSSIDSASKNLKYALSNTSIDYTSIVIQETNIIDVIKKQ